MNSRKRTFEYDTLKKDNEGIVSKHETDCVKDRHNKMKEYLMEFFKEVKNNDRMDDCFECLAKCLTNSHFSNQLAAEVDALESKCKVSMDFLHCDTSQECSSEHTQRNMIGNTSCVTKNRFENSKIQRSSYLFADTSIKSGLNSFGGRFKEAVKPVPLVRAFNPTFPPFSSSETCKTFLPALAKDNVHPEDKFMDNMHGTMPSNTNLEEKERYKSLLEKYSNNKLYFSTAIPALKNLQEWNELINSKKLDSIGSKVTLDNDEDPLFLDIEPTMPAELPSGLFKGKLTVEFVHGLKKLLDQDYQKERKSIEERRCRISMHYEKQAADRATKRASFLKKLRKDRLAGSRDALPELTPKMDPVFDDVVMSPNTPNQEC